MQTLEAVDTHTGGEPTRVVFRGGPDLGSGSMSERLQILRDGNDWLRTTLILEPRGSDWIVGALLQEPVDPASVVGIIFFNNVGYLGMCGHGFIGVVEALAYRGRIAAGEHRFETPVGVVSARLHEDRSVSITNVESFRFRKDVEVQVPDDGIVIGDVAYGGNWFFLTAVTSLDPADIETLTARSKRISMSLRDQGVCGSNAAEIDHIELFAPPSDPSKADSRSFVLCPGGEYDRSPCGTGTSAKLACLAADGRLQPGDVWRQESIVGSVFEGRYTDSPNGITPEITGRAFVTGETTFVLDEADPFRHGIPRIGSQDV
ncbi:MAG: proline racemase family protein [Planctomycetota bacterium]|nr:proline racemase family protein [Planctomycetota bacterium]